MSHSNLLTWFIFCAQVFLQTFSQRQSIPVRRINEVLQTITIEKTFTEEVEGVDILSSVFCQDFFLGRHLREFSDPITNVGDFESMVGRVTAPEVLFSCSADVVYEPALNVTEGKVVLSSAETFVNLEFELLSEEFRKFTPIQGIFGEQTCDDLIDFQLELTFDMDDGEDIPGPFADAFTSEMKSALEEELCPKLKTFARGASKVATSSFVPKYLAQRPPMLEIWEFETFERELSESLDENSTMTHLNNIITDDLIAHLQTQLSLSPLFMNVSGVALQVVEASNTAQGIASGLQTLMVTSFGYSVEIDPSWVDEIVSDQCYIDLRVSMLEFLSQDTSEATMQIPESCSNTAGIKETLLPLFQSLYEDLPLLETVVDEFFAVLTRLETPASNSDSRLVLDFTKFGVETISYYLSFTVEDIVMIFGGNSAVLLEGVSEYINLDVEIGELLAVLQGDDVDKVIFPWLDLYTTEPQRLRIQDLIDLRLREAALFLDGLVPPLQPYLDDIIERDLTFGIILEEYISVEVEIGALGNLYVRFHDIWVDLSMSLETHNAPLVGKGTMLLPFAEVDGSLRFDLRIESDVGSRGYSEVPSRIQYTNVLKNSLTTAFNYARLEGFGFQKVTYVQDLLSALLDLAACGTGSLSMASTGHGTPAVQDFGFPREDFSNDFEGDENALVDALGELYFPAAATAMERAIPLLLASVTSGDVSQSWFSIASTTQDMCFRNPAVGVYDNEETESNSSDVIIAGFVGGLAGFFILTCIFCCACLTCCCNPEYESSEFEGFGYCCWVLACLMCLSLFPVLCNDIFQTRRTSRIIVC